MTKRRDAAKTTTFEFTLILVTAFVASTVRANPIELDSGSLVAFPIVAAAALAVEAGIVTFLLRLSGCALAVFPGYFLTNLAVFLLMIGALFMGLHVSIFVLELLVVILDAVCIKLLTAFEPFQGEDFRGVSWLRAVLISLAGNAASFFLGLAVSGTFFE